MFCIFCGNVADGDVVLQCTTCSRVHYLNSKYSSSALVVRNGVGEGSQGKEYLQIKRAIAPELGKWDTPGGFCEYGEDPAVAAVRETFEETGFVVTTDALLGVWMDTYEDKDGYRWPTANLVYLASLSDVSLSDVSLSDVSLSDVSLSDVSTVELLVDASVTAQVVTEEVSEMRWVPVPEKPPTPLENTDMAFPAQQCGALRALLSRG
jgi:8-oxo-dGTP diphosphatase